MEPPAAPGTEAASCSSQATTDPPGHLPANPAAARLTEASSYGSIATARFAEVAVIAARQQWQTPEERERAERKRLIERAEKARERALQACHRARIALEVAPAKVHDLVDKHDQDVH